MIELGLTCKIYLASQAKLPCFQRRKAPKFATFGKNGHFALRWARFKATARPHISPTGIPKPHFAHRQLRCRESRPFYKTSQCFARHPAWQNLEPIIVAAWNRDLCQPRRASRKGQEPQTPLKQESGASPARSAREMRFIPKIAGSSHYSHYAMRHACPYAYHGRFSCKLCRGSKCPSGQTPV